MRTKSNYYKLIVVLISAYGLYEHLLVGIAKYGLNIFYFFTVLSNIGVFLYYIFFGFRENPKRLRLKSYLLLPILLTGVVNWFILLPVSLKVYGSILPLFQPSNFFVHGLIPLLFLLDWFLFDPKGIYTAKEPLKWCILPYVYIVVIYVRAYFGGPVFDNTLYPYPFFDPKQMNGWTNVWLMLIFLNVAYLIVGYLLYSKKAVKQIKG